MAGSEKDNPSPFHSTMLPAPGSVGSDLSQVARGYVEAIREELEAAHWAGASGLDTAAVCTEALDRLVKFIFDHSTERFRRRYATTRQQCAVLALGGYGRGEQSPYSDVDILVLHSGRITPFVETVAESVLYTLFDARLEAGQSVRSLEECRTLAAEDLTIKTSLFDARYLCGDMDLIAEFRDTVVEHLRTTDVEAYCNGKIAEMRGRHAKSGGAVFMLEPNVKEAQGGLRDLHLARWLSFVKTGSADLLSLVEKNLLLEREYEEIEAAREHLMRVRHSLHFRTGRKTDIITFEMQEQVSERLGFGDEDGVRPGDRFLHGYYEHAAVLARDCGDLIDRLMAPEDAPGRVERFFKSRTMSSGITAVGDRVVLDEASLEKEPLNILRVFADAQSAGVKLSAETRNILRTRSDLLSEEVMARPEAIQLFFDILTADSGVYATLVEMNRLGVLGRVIPEFGRLYCMVQHEWFHVYTVDEHSLIGVRELERVRDGAYEEESPFLTGVMRDCDRIDLLYLAMMFHDIGKGYGGDHDEHGERIARDIAARFGLNEDDTSTLAFLVRNHLLMSTLAQTRDIEEPGLVLDFMHQVGTPRNLRLIYLLTFADMRAVGPKIWSSWKDHLLGELYRRAEFLFDRGIDTDDDMHERAARVRSRVVGLVEGDGARASLEEFLQGLPYPYFLALPSDARVLDDWQLYDSRDGAPFRSGVVHHRRRGFSEFTVFAVDRVGLFSDLTGVLLANGLSVLSCRLMTSSLGWVLDTFRIRHDRVAGVGVGAGGGAEAHEEAEPVEIDPETGEPVSTEPLAVRPEVWAQVDADLDAVFARQVSVEELVAPHLVEPKPKYGVRKVKRARPPRVEIDNEASQRRTVVDVYAPDRPGLVFLVSRAMYEQGLSIYTAKIATQLGEAQDVFYVTDAAGQKIEDPDVQEALRQSILAALASDPDPALAGGSDPAGGSVASVTTPAEPILT